MPKVKRRQRLRFALILVSLLLFPVTIWYFSPYLIVMGAAAGVASGSMVFFTLLLVQSFVLGRGFCGWACPVGGLQEALFRVNDRPARGGRRDWSKYFIWVPWVGAIIAAAVAAGGIRRIEPLYMTWHGISIAEPGGWVVYYAVMALVVVPAIAWSRRFFCHYICWLAPFMVVGTWLRERLRLPSLHLRADRAKCTACGTCTRRCPMSLDVQGMVERGSMRNVECILCGMCVDGCPGSAIRFRFGRPR